MKQIPQLIFKYRTLSSITDLDRVIDIIKNNRLYLPTVMQVNDPFEGKLNIYTSYAGYSIIKAMDEDYSAVRNCKEHTRILSLSDDCFSPQLWAYYCNDYHGVCFCFRTDGTFHSIEPVTYPETLEEGEPQSANSLEMIYDMMREKLFVKQEGWRYEKEWRMVIQDSIPQEDENEEEEEASSPFLDYDSSEFVGIILGKKLEENLKEMIRMITPDSVKVFETHTGALSGKVKLKEFGYIYPGDGSDPDYISSTNELYARINSY